MPTKRISIKTYAIYSIGNNKEIQKSSKYSVKIISLNQENQKKLQAEFLTGQTKAIMTVR